MTALPRVIAGEATATAAGRAAPPAKLWRAFEALRAEGLAKAGAPEDLKLRARELGKLFDDSGQSHTFALVAGHGALFMDQMIQLGSMGQRVVGPLHRRLLAPYFRGLQEAQRDAFVDLYAAYHFTQQYGGKDGAARVLARGVPESSRPEALTAALNALHAKRAAGGRLDAAERLALYELALAREQSIVQPMVERTLRSVPRPIAELVRRPVVRLPYFPLSRVLHVRDFGSSAQRVRTAMSSYEIAEEQAVAQGGWNSLVEPLLRQRAGGQEFFP